MLTSSNHYFYMSLGKQICNSLQNMMKDSEKHTNKEVQKSQDIFPKLDVQNN